LGVDAVEDDRFSCCGAGIVEEEDPEFEHALNARNFALAEAEGRDILVICNTCLLTMLRTQRNLAENPPLLEQTNADLSEIGFAYSGKVRVTHLLWLLRDEIGIERLADLVTAPLEGTKVAPFYGCHILRPSDILSDDATPDFLSRLIEVCGAETVDYGGRYDCCGFHILLNDHATSLKMTAKCLSDADRSGADLLVTPCTLCHISLDGYQKPAIGDSQVQIPILHLAQMIGLGLGIDRNELGLDRNLVGMA